MGLTRALAIELAPHNIQVNDPSRPLLPVLRPADERRNGQGCGISL